MTGRRLLYGVFVGLGLLIIAVPASSLLLRPEVEPKTVLPSTTTPIEKATPEPPNIQRPTGTTQAIDADAPQSSGDDLLETTQEADNAGTLDTSEGIDEVASVTVDEALITRMAEIDASTVELKDEPAARSSVSSVSDVVPDRQSLVKTPQEFSLESTKDNLAGDEAARAIFQKPDDQAVLDSAQVVEGALSPSLKRPDPYACNFIVDHIAPDEYKLKIAERLSNPLASDQPDHVYHYCVLAELMRRTGDPRAGEYQQLTISEYPDEPAFDLFYANYLQYFRGVRGGLTSAADFHHRRAVLKVDALKSNGKWGEKNDGRTLEEIRRGLLLSHRADGIPLTESSEGNPSSPQLYFSQVGEYARDTVGFDAFIDSREFTSEALFAQSVGRLDRMLTLEELRSIARTKPRYRTTSRVRLKLKNIRQIDFTYRLQNAENARIPNFSEPTVFDNVRSQEFGLAIANDFQVGRNTDLYISGAAKRIRQTATAEFVVGEKETINEYEFRAGASRLVGAGKIQGEAGFIRQDFNPGFDRDSANIYIGKIVYQSRLFGLNRLVLDGSFVYQDIEPGITGVEFDDRRAIILSGGYELPLSSRGENGNQSSIELTMGYVNDVERIGSQDIKEQEGYIGVKLRRLTLSESLNPFDATFRTGLYRQESTERASQLRNEFSLNYRLVDSDVIQWRHHESAIHPASVDLTLQLRHDSAHTGLDAFENYRVGISLGGELMHPGRGHSWTSHWQFGYSFERFYNIDKDVHALTLRVGSGF